MLSVCLVCFNTSTIPWQTANIWSYPMDNAHLSSTQGQPLANSYRAIKAVREQHPITNHRSLRNLKVNLASCGPAEHTFPATWWRLGVRTQPSHTQIPALRYVRCSHPSFALSNSGIICYAQRHNTDVKLYDFIIGPQSPFWLPW